MNDYSRYPAEDLLNCFSAVCDVLVHGVEPDKEMLEAVSRGEYAAYAARRENDASRNVQEKEIEGKKWERSIR